MNSLFRITGNLTPRLRKRSGISDLIRVKESEIREFPCIFPAYQGSTPRDPLPRDSLHLLGVRFGLDCRVAAAETSGPSTPSTATAYATAALALRFNSLPG